MMEWKLHRWEQNTADFWGICHRNWVIMTILQQKDFPEIHSCIKSYVGGVLRAEDSGLLELVELQKDKKKRLRTFSGGMLRRVGIAQALLNNPEILVLDEPTAGLDPKERVKFRNIISSLGKEKTVLLSTHIVSDIEYIADQILIMKDGKLICSGTEQGITASVKGYVWKCNVSADMAQKLCNQYMVSNLRNGSEENQAELRIISEKCPFPDAELAEETLEDAYLYQTQDIDRIRSRRDENAVV